MADDPWAVVPEQDDHEVLDFLNFIDFTDPEEYPFDVSMWDFNNNANMSNNGGEGGSQTDFTDPPSQIFEPGENAISLSELPSQISESEHNSTSLPDLPSQIFKSGSSTVVSQSETPSQFSESRDNSSSLQDLPPQIFKSRDNIASLPYFPSHFSKSRACISLFGTHAYGAGRSASSSQDDHSSRTLREVGESSYNPLAEKFGKRSTIEDKASHIFLAANEPSQFFRSRGSYISLADIPSQLNGAVGNALHSLEDHHSHHLIADAESSFNPLAEIFGERRTAILGDHPSQILRQPNYSSQFLGSLGLDDISLADQPLQLHGAGRKIANSLNDHPSPIFKAGGELSPNPLAEIFGERKSAIFGDYPSQIWRQPNHSSHFSGSLGPHISHISVANHPSKLHGVGGSFSISLNNHPLPIFRARGESSSNPLAEVFRHRVSTLSLEDHPSLDNHSPHVFKAGGELGFGKNLLHNAEGSRNNNTSQPLSVTRLQRRSIPFICNGCQVVKKFVLCNYKNFITLYIHGKLGVICHAIEERRTNIYHMYGGYRDPIYEKFDFHSKSLDEVKHFLTQYCEELKADGYVRQHVRVQSSSQDSGVAVEEDEWEDVLSYHEEFFPDEEFDSDDYSPTNSDDMEHQHADDKASWKWKGKGKCQLPKRRVTLEQRHIAARIKLEDLRVYFHLTAEEACEKLGLPFPYFKRLCRKFGVGRWPCRKIRAISKEIQKIRPLLFSNNRRTREFTAARIECMKKEMAKLLHYGR